MYTISLWGQPMLSFLCIPPEMTYMFINGSRLNKWSVLCTYLCILNIDSFFILFLWSHNFLLLNVIYLKVPFCQTSRLPFAFAATDNISVNYLINLSLHACTSVYASSVSGFKKFFNVFVIKNKKKKKECGRKRKEKNIKCSESGGY